MDDKKIDEILKVLLDFCNIVLIPAVIKSKNAIKCIPSKSDKFNARVTTDDCANFLIIVNRGVLKSIVHLVESIDDETINDEIKEISNELFSSESYDFEILQLIAYQAVIFIVTHEFAHIFRGHLTYIFNKNDIGRGTSDVSFSFSELEPKLLLEADDFDDNFVKLAELDADVSALHILMQVSVEILAQISERFQEMYPNWKNDDLTKWSIVAKRLIFYSSTIALSIIESKRQNNENYPLPFTRIMNLFDGYKQDMYKESGIISDVYSSEIQYLDITSQMRTIEERIAYDFMNSVDIMVEGSRLLNNDISLKFGNNEEGIYKKLLYDLLKISTNLNPNDLETEEGEEYSKLRLYRPQLYSKFSPFITQTF